MLIVKIEFYPLEKQSIKLNFLCQKSISYRGPMFWNKVPNSLKNKKQSLGSFCKNLHKFACKYTE